MFADIHVDFSYITGITITKRMRTWLLLFTHNVWLLFEVVTMFEITSQSANVQMSKNKKKIHSIVDSLKYVFWKYIRTIEQQELYFSFYKIWTQFWLKDRANSLLLILFNSIYDIIHIWYSFYVIEYYKSCFLLTHIVLILFSSP
jgi:hypothetical protein